MAVKGYSARALCGYITVESGEGESTTDGVYGGHALIAECGGILAERAPFAPGTALTVTELDLERVVHDRRVSSFDTSATGEITEVCRDVKAALSRMA